MNEMWIQAGIACFSALGVYCAPIIRERGASKAEKDRAVESLQETLKVADQ